MLMGMVVVVAVVIHMLCDVMWCDMLMVMDMWCDNMLMGMVVVVVVVVVAVVIHMLCDVMWHVNGDGHVMW